MAPDEEIVNHVELPETVHEKSRNASLNSMVESEPESPIQPHGSDDGYIALFYQRSAPQ